MGKLHKFMESGLRTGNYRPFTKQRFYFDKPFIESPGLNSKIFIDDTSENLAICTSGLGGNKENTIIIINKMADLNMLDAGTQCFPLYYYEENQRQNLSLFDEEGDSQFIRRDGVSDFILKRAYQMYGKTVNKEDIFYYVYGFLNSSEYRKTFANDLKKMLPRLPLVEDIRDFIAFNKAGRELTELHINYENIPAFEDVEITGTEYDFFKVKKMRFSKKDQKDTIIYNSKIIISNIPVKAYEYVINGKSAIEWIMERYQMTTNKDSGIKNNPNDWADETGNPKYIFDLLLSIINVSVQSVDIIKSLPKLTFNTSGVEPSKD